MHKVFTAVAATAVLGLAGAPAAYASHGGGGGATAPGIDLSGTWTGVESSFFGDRTAVLSLARKGSSYDGSYAELIAGDSPVFKLSSLTVSGQSVTIVFTQGGKPGLHPDVSLRVTLSADGRTLSGVFGTVPVALTR
jgi:hypothetical protein